VNAPARPSPLVIKLFVIVAALLIATTVVGLKVNELREQAQLSPHAHLSADADTGAATPNTNSDPEVCCGDAAAPADDMSALFGAGGAASTMPKNGRPLKGVPADLPLYNDARPLFGFEQEASGWVQQMGVWTIADADAGEVMQFYQRAVEKGGFKPLGNPSNPTENGVYHRGKQTLLVKARQAGASVRLSLIFRYTM